MKKVLFAIESLSGGGAEKVLSTLIKHIDKSKFDITVLLVAEKGVYLDEVKKYCKVKFMLPDYDKLDRFIDKAKYKLEYKFIYTADPKKVYMKYIKEEYDVEIAFVEGFVTKLIANSINSKSKKYAWVHIDLIMNPYADQYYKNIEEETDVYKKYDKIINVSESVKRVTSKKFLLNSNLEVIYNPLDKDEITNKSVEFIEKRSTDTLRLITVGRLVNQKGYDRLIKALARIKTDNTNYELLILGEGPMRHELEELIKENKLEKSIKLMGFKNNPYPYIASSDIFICTSRAEGFSLVIAEAMILGKPIISVNCSGPNELLDNGKYGILIDNNDEEIYKILYSLIHKHINLKDLCELSKKRGEFFNLEHIINQVEKLLDTNG